MRNGAKSNQSVAIDMLRGLSILYIVGFWHLFDSTNQFSAYKNPVTHNLTVVVLSIFVFLSGFLMAGGVGKKPFPALGDFFKTRFLKIYPPFAVVAIIFFVFGLIDRGTLIKTLSLVSIFWGPTAPTIWFIGMIAVFYLLTPFLIRASELSRRSLFICGVLFYLVFWVFGLLVSSADGRLLLYFPSFVMGIFTARFDPIAPTFMKPVAASVIGASVLLVWWCPEIEPQYLPQFAPVALLGAWLVFSWARRLPYGPRSSWLASTLAGPSYMLFLLHRPVYAFMKRVYWPEGAYQILYLLLVCLPIAFISSVFAHRIYEAMFKKVMRV